jgi:hypothetical protein
VATALARQLVGIGEELDGRWLVTFANIDLGHIGPNNKVTPIPQPDLDA